MDHDEFVTAGERDLVDRRTFTHRLILPYIPVVCVRYNTVDERWERWIKGKGIWIAIKLPPEQLQLFPGRTGHIVVKGEGGRLELIEAKWGLQPPWAKVATFGARNCYNARIEGSENPKPGQKPGIENMPSFRYAFRNNRCLVPIASYYESADMPEAVAAKRYVEVFPAEDEAFVMAGLYERPDPLAADQTPTFTLVTTGSNGRLAEVHSRRLARLDDDVLGTWMDLEAPIDLLKAIVQPRDEEPIRLEDAEPPRRKTKAD